jgi:hypothetical protein
LDDLLGVVARRLQCRQQIIVENKHPHGLTWSHRRTARAARPC